MSNNNEFPVNKSEKEWKEMLTKKEFLVLRKGKTDPPFNNKYYEFDKKGIFKCAACNNELFHSKDKYDSGSGWPSFTKPISKDSVKYRKDNKLSFQRTEVICSNCGSHLGHRFNDGPDPHGLRYCMNSTSLKFEEQNKL